MLPSFRPALRPPLEPCGKFIIGGSLGSASSPNGPIRERSAAISRSKPVDVGFEDAGHVDGFARAQPMLLQAIHHGDDFEGEGARIGGRVKCSLGLSGSERSGDHGGEN